MKKREERKKEEERKEGGKEDLPWRKNEIQNMTTNAKSIRAK